MPDGSGRDTDLLRGARAIREAFPQLLHSERQVYQVREANPKGCPIRKVPGLGLVASRPALARYLGVEPADLPAGDGRG